MNTPTLDSGAMANATLPRDNIPGIGPNERRIAGHLTQDEIALAVIALEQFHDLISDSQGVVGLHRSGDVAPWDELRGTWLDTFDEAIAPIRQLRLVRMDELERQIAKRVSA